MKEPLNFSEFKHIDIDEWIRDLKNTIPSLNEDLSHTTWFDIPIHSFYNQNDHPIEIQDFDHNSDWIVADRITKKHYSEANQAALTCLQQGCNGLFLN